MDEFVGPIVFLVTIGAIFAAVTMAARRYARRKQREGLWDEKGPKDDTLPPADFLRVHPRPWGIQRPTIETEIEEENPFLYPVEKKHDSDSDK
jgi:hypothetical protein